VDTPHHVTQRGNGRQAVFLTDKDREVHLDAFFDYAARYGLRVWGYCLMSNHVHFVVVPEGERSLARVFGRTHSDYARYANLLRRSCGHFWQSRFYSCAMDEPHAWEALAYVERNPVRAGLAEKAEEYPWSTAAAHCREDGLDGLGGRGVLRNGVIGYCPRLEPGNGSQAARFSGSRMISSICGLGMSAGT
jgi:putative transposase